jgi:hypothetical protein
LRRDRTILEEYAAIKRGLGILYPTQRQFYGWYKFHWIHDAINNIDSHSGGDWGEWFSAFQQELFINHFRPDFDGAVVL